MPCKNNRRYSSFTTSTLSRISLSDLFLFRFSLLSLVFFFFYSFEYKDKMNRLWKEIKRKKVKKSC